MSLFGSARINATSFDDFSKVLALANQQHAAYDDAYTLMETKASLMDLMASLEENSKTRLMYLQYADAFKAGLDSFREYGITSPASYLLLLEARRSYAKNIVPLEYAAEERNKRVEEERRQEAAGNVRFTNRASEAPLEQFLPGAKFNNKTVNLDLLYTKGSTLGKAWSSREENITELTAFKGDYYRLRKEIGIDNATTEKALSLAQNALSTGMNELIESGLYPSLMRGINNLLNSSGAKELNSADYMDAINYLLEGVNAGITHTTTDNLQENWRAKENYRAAIAAAQAAAALNTGNLGLGMYDPGESTLSGNSYTNPNTKNYKIFYKNNWIVNSGPNQNRLSKTGLQIAELGKVLSLLLNRYNQLQHKRNRTKDELKELVELTRSLHNAGAINFYSPTGKDVKSKEVMAKIALYENLKALGYYSKDVKQRNQALIKFNLSMLDIAAGKTEVTPTITIYNQNITNPTSSNNIINNLLNLGKATIYKVKDIDRQNHTIIADSKGIHASDLLDKDTGQIKGKITRMSMVPSMPGAILLKINGEDYILSPEQARTLLGGLTYSSYEGETKNIDLSTSPDAKANSINNAHNFMARLGLGTGFVSDQLRDASGGIDFYDYQY